MCSCHDPIHVDVTDVASEKGSYSAQVFSIILLYWIWAQGRSCDCEGKPYSCCLHKQYNVCSGLICVDLLCVICTFIHWSHELYLHVHMVMCKGFAQHYINRCVSSKSNRPVEAFQLFAFILTNGLGTCNETGTEKPVIDQGFMPPPLCLFCSNFNFQ